MKNTNAITITLPESATAADVAALQRIAESNAPIIASVKVTSAEEYAFADALLTETVTRKDAAIGMRKAATVPLYHAVRTIEGWFRPVVAALEGSERHLKRAMGAWRIEVADAERAAREVAATAAEAGDASAMLEAISVATAIAATPADAGARATVRYVWTVARITAALVPREWLTPDVARLSAIARETPGDAPAPVVPGVEFERVARVGARR